MNAQRWQIVSKARRGTGTAMFQVADQHPQAALRIAGIGCLLEAPQDVQFNQPVFFYVENFLNLPIGETVPVGAYDNTRGTWQATPNGRVLKLLGISAGFADLDVTGDGIADDSATLAALGILDAEREVLARQYSVGVSLWRAPLSHFSIRDLNWPYGCIIKACVEPNGGNPTSLDDSPDDRTAQCGSVLECESQTLGETEGIAGTPFTLNYRGDRVPGRAGAYSLRIPLGGPMLPANPMIGIDLEFGVAGRRFYQTFPASPKHGEPIHM